MAGKRGMEEWEGREGGKEEGWGGREPPRVGSHPHVQNKKYPGRGYKPG